MNNIIVLVTISVFICFVQSKVLPDYIQDLVCPISHPKYEKCLLKSIEKSRPLLLKGIPALNFPPLDPFELPIMTVDRTLNNLVSIKAILRNVKVTGSGNAIIEDIKANPKNLTGEIRLTFPGAHLSMEYDVKGQLLVVPLQSQGFFSGNFTGTQLFVKGNGKLVDKNGVKYLMVDNIFTKMRIGDGEVKLIAKNPDLQIGADLIANFYNQNPRLVMDAINPIAVETSNDVMRVIMNQILASIPAKELLRE